MPAFLEDINYLPDILIRSVVSVSVLFLLSKIVGARQLSELTFYDYIVGISIGSIAAEMAFDRTVPFSHPLAAMLVYSLFSLLLAFITDKSIKARRMITGTPTVIIKNGKILEPNMKHIRLDINELLRECRTNGYFNVSDIEFAFMENNGKMSFIPKSANRPVTVQDLNISVTQEKPQISVIIDGKVLEDNLKASGNDKNWLNKELRSMGYKTEDVLLANVGSDNTLTVFKK